MTLTKAFELFIFENIKLQGGAKKTQINYQTAINSLLTCIPDIPVKLLTLEHIVKWKMAMDERGNSINTISHNLSCLRSVLRFLRTRGQDVLDPSSVSLPKIKRHQPTFLDYSEVQYMLDCCDNPRDKAIIACLFSTGCRISELLDLDRGDIREHEAMVTGKGSKQRVVYFDNTALRLLDEYESTRRDHLKPLFVSSQNRRLTVSRVQQVIHEIADRAGMEKNVTPHVFRHSYITDLVLNGAPLPVIQKLAGHTQLSTTMIYTHITDKNTQETHSKYHSKIT